MFSRNLVYGPPPKRSLAECTKMPAPPDGSVTADVQGGGAARRLRRLVSTLQPSAYALSTFRHAASALGTLRHASQTSPLSQHSRKLPWARSRRRVSEEPHLDGRGGRYRTPPTTKS